MTTPPPDVTARMGRGTALALLAGAAVGTLAFFLVSTHGERAGFSYLGGYALVVGAFEFGQFNIRLTDRHAPELTLAVAMFSYLTTAIALALVLAASSPRVVDGPGIASGLGVGLVLWLGGLFARSRVRSERLTAGVNITLHNETYTKP